MILLYNLGLSNPDVIPVPAEPPILNIGLLNTLFIYYPNILAPPDAKKLLNILLIYLPKYNPASVVPIPRAVCNGVGLGT